MHTPQPDYREYLENIKAYLMSVQMKHIRKMEAKHGSAQR